ncbi:MAG: hypothetical protein KatS3mg076_2947 [Candidatus Binatia bacterium]|nr:MAG: hypothetical protein KatS3mg076_2947 [Candidatus Binatia bacterium]
MTSLGLFLSLRLPTARFRADFGRLALSVVAVGLGVGLVVGFLVMNGAVMGSFLGVVDGMVGRAELTVRGSEGVTFGEEVVEAVRGVEGVEVAVPLVRAVTFLDDGSGEVLTVHGVDLGSESEVRVYYRGDGKGVVEDWVEFLSQEDSVVLGEEYAREKGIAVGDRVELVTPRGVEGFVVRGLVGGGEGLVRALRGRLVVMDLWAAERAFTSEGQINQIDVVVRDGESVEAVKGRIEGVVPEGLRVEEPVVRKEVIRRTVGGFQAMLVGFSFLAVVAGFVVSLSRLGAVFEGRMWEVGLLRAVGVRRRMVVVELMKEGVLVGVLGTVLGWVVGAGVASVGLPYLARTTAIAFRLPVPEAEVSFGVWSFVVGGLVGVVAAVAAAWAAARRVAGANVVGVLRTRGREWVEWEGERRRLALGWSGAIALGVVGLLVLERVTGQAWIGHGTTALVAVWAGVSAGPLVRVLGGWVVKVWERAFGVVGWVAAGGLVWRPRRSALTVGTLGIGLGFVLLLGMLGWSFERTLVEQLAGRLTAALLIVSSAFTTSRVTAKPRSTDELLEAPARPFRG